jgi:hypothetical protein
MEDRFTKAREKLIVEGLKLNNDGKMKVLAL